MAFGYKVVLRLGSIVLYLLLFAFIYAGLHHWLAATPEVQESRRYQAGAEPDYFQILVVEKGDGTGDRLVLRSLARQEYQGGAGKQQSWAFYGVAGAGRLDVAEPVHFTISALPAGGRQVEVTVAETNGQRTSIYTYELTAGRVAPRSHVILAAFGNNLSPLPVSVLLAGILIFLSERFLVRRLRAAN